MTDEQRNNLILLVYWFNAFETVAIKRHIHLRTHPEWRFSAFKNQRMGKWLMLHEVIAERDQITSDEALLKLYAEVSGETTTSSKLEWKKEEEQAIIKPVLFEEEIKWSKEAAIFFILFAISAEIVKMYKVKSLKYFYYKSKKSQQLKIVAKPGNVIFAFSASHEGTSFKIYQPYSKFRFAHVGAHRDEGYIFGYDQLPDKVPYLIVTSGEKEVLALRQAGIFAVCLNSETATITPTIFKKLLKKVDNEKDLTLLYDIDETGKKSSERLSKKFGFSIITDFIPDGLTLQSGKIVKDASDYFRYFVENKDVTGYLRAIKELQEKIRNIFNREGRLSAENFEGFFHPVISALSFPGVDSKILPYKIVGGNVTENNDPLLLYPNKPHRYVPVTTDRVRTAAQRLQDAQLQPAQPELAGAFFKMGSITMLFSNTGVGKTLLGYYLAYHLSKGSTIILGFTAINEPLRVLYYDFEMPDKAFQSRYNGLEFSDNLWIATSFVEEEDGFSEKILLDDINRLQIDVVVIDNITALSMGSHTEADIAISTMKALKRIQRKTGVTIIVIAHTPKIPDQRPLHLNQMGGSKMISNFSDSVVGLARSSQGKNFRYLKQLKFRHSEHSDDVHVYRIDNLGNFFDFVYEGRQTEAAQLKGKSLEESAKQDERILEARRLHSEENMSYAEIAKKLGVSKSTAGNWCKGHKGTDTPNEEGSTDDE